MNTGDASHQRLAAAIEARKRELRFEWEEIAAASDITSAHLRKFRAGGTGLRPKTRARLETALLWEVGAFDLILKGDAPVPLNAPMTTAQAITGPSLQPELAARAVVRATAGGSLAIVIPAAGATDEEIQWTADRLADFVRRLEQEESLSEDRPA